jgi:RHS repeat-associated protein
MNSHRYGFNGYEKDDEIAGEGNSLNYKYRMHDPRVGRFFAVDPLAPKYPHNSPYAFSENTVINAVELEGLEKEVKTINEYGSASQYQLSNSREDKQSYQKLINYYYNLYSGSEVGAGYYWSKGYNQYTATRTAPFGGTLTRTFDGSGVVELSYTYVNNNESLPDLSVGFWDAWSAGTDAFGLIFIYDNGSYPGVDRTRLNAARSTIHGYTSIVAGARFSGGNLLKSAAGNFVQGASLNLGVQSLQQDFNFSKIDYTGVFAAGVTGVFFTKSPFVASIGTAAFDATVDWSPYKGFSVVGYNKPIFNTAIDFGFSTAGNYFGGTLTKDYNSLSIPSLTIEGLNDLFFLMPSYNINRERDKRNE